jgi:hypothetical protein
MAGLIWPRRCPSSSTRVADLADQFPAGDPHPQPPASAAMADRVGRQLVDCDHHVNRAAFGHTCGRCVCEHCLAKDTQRGLTELLVQRYPVPPPMGPAGEYAKTVTAGTSPRPLPLLLPLIRRSPRLVVTNSQVPPQLIRSPAAVVR